MRHEHNDVNKDKSIEQLHQQTYHEGHKNLPQKNPSEKHLTAACQNLIASPTGEIISFVDAH